VGEALRSRKISKIIAGGNGKIKATAKDFERPRKERGLRQGGEADW